MYEPSLRQMLIFGFHNDVFVMLARVNNGVELWFRFVVYINSKV